MDWTTILIGVVVVVLLALFLYNRRRPVPRGTYNDDHVQSSGSIGGGPRAHDDPTVQSSGSIGGGVRAYDDPAHKSGGSIGGGPATRGERRTVPDPSKGDYTYAKEDQRTEYDEKEARRLRIHDGGDVRSSGGKSR